jgi:hypothetical protein
LVYCVKKKSGNPGHILAWIFSAKMKFSAFDSKLQSSDVKNIQWHA